MKFTFQNLAIFSAVFALQACNLNKADVLTMKTTSTGGKTTPLPSEMPHISQIRLIDEKTNTVLLTSADGVTSMKINLDTYQLGHDYSLKFEFSLSVDEGSLKVLNKADDMQSATIPFSGGSVEYVPSTLAAAAMDLSLLDENEAPLSTGEPFHLVLECPTSCDVKTTSPPVKTDPPKTDPPKTDPPKTDPPKTDPPKTDPPVTTKPLPQTFTVVVLGSSSAEGVGASSKAKSWVGLTTSYFQTAVGTGFKLSNLAVGGYVTKDILASGGKSGHNITAAINAKPDLIVVSMPGGNDTDAGVSIDQMLKNFMSVRDTAKAKKIPIFFVGAAPKSKLSATQRADLKALNGKEAPEFKTCTNPEGKDYSTCFIDVFSSLAASDNTIKPDYEAKDQTHLVDAGHKVIADHAIPVLQAYICGRVTCTKK